MNLSTLLLYLATSTAAEPPIEPLISDWIVVDAASWLYERPTEDAPRLRSTMVREAPEYQPAPVVVLRRFARAGEFIGVHTAAHVADVAPDGRPRAPDTVPIQWPHCYPQPAAFAQLDLELWVHERDILKVVTRPVEATTPDGSTVRLEPGLTASGRDGRYRVRSHHLMLLVSIPDDAVGEGYEIGLGPPDARTWFAEYAGGSFSVHPTFTATLDGFGPTLQRDAGPDADAVPVTGLGDRCVMVRPSRPLTGIPRRDETALRDGSTWPIQVPSTTEVTRPDGTVLGKVAFGNQVLWSRAACAWSDATGLCCDRVSGIETAGEGDHGMCFEADLPKSVEERSLNAVVVGRNDTMKDRIDASYDTVPQVTWSRPVVRGAISDDDVLQALDAEAERLAYCYDRAVIRYPGLAGDLSVRFPVAPDGRARAARVEKDTLDNPVLLDCVLRRLQALIVPNQIGQTASVVDLDVRFSLVPTHQAADAAPGAPTPRQ